MSSEMDDTDSTVCVNCQRPGGELLKQPKTYSYKTFPGCTAERIQYEDTDFMHIRKSTPEKVNLAH